MMGSAASVERSTNAIAINSGGSSDYEPGNSTNYAARYFPNASLYSADDGIKHKRTNHDNQTVSKDTATNNITHHRQQTSKVSNEKMEMKTAQGQLELDSINNLQKQLKMAVNNLKVTYADWDFEMPVILLASRKINNVESKYGNKISSLRRNDTLQEKMAKVREDRSRYLHRLSELASVRLKHNNPCIADLSDPNRASKLAEKLSELYDNQWTDVFEATTKHKKHIDHKDTAICLRKILMYCYNQCSKCAQDQRKNLLYQLTLSKSDNPSPSLQLRIKEFQKLASPYTLTHVQSIVCKGIVTKEELQLVITNEKLLSKPPVKSYVELCTEITWLMQILDPPAVLDMSNIPNNYKSYTIIGPYIDYVLWPAMLLSETGPLVIKGVAQFKKINSVNKQNDDNATIQKNKLEYV